MIFPDEPAIDKRRYALRVRRDCYSRCTSFWTVALLVIQEVRDKWIAGASSPVNLTVNWSNKLNQNGWDRASAALLHELKKRTHPTVTIEITRINATDLPGANLRFTIKEDSNV